MSDYLNAKQKFILILVPILFIGTWITLGIVNSIQNPAPPTPDSRQVFEEACLKNGGVPNTKPYADNWTCNKL